MTDNNESNNKGKLKNVILSFLTFLRKVFKKDNLIKMIITSYIFFIALFFIYILIAFWPHKDGGSQVWSKNIWIFGRNFVMDFEQQLLILAVVGGGIGSIIHALTSFGDYLGNKEFETQWAVWYIFRPVIGNLIGIVFYLLLRGGIMAVQVNGQDGITDNLNPYTIISITILAGMFSKQAIDKCNDVLNILLQSESSKKRKDKLVKENADS